MAEGYGTPPHECKSSAENKESLISLEESYSVVNIFNRGSYFSLFLDEKAAWTDSHDPFVGISTGDLKKMWPYDDFKDLYEGKRLSIILEEDKTLDASWILKICNSHEDYPISKDIVILEGINTISRIEKEKDIYQALIERSSPLPSPPYSFAVDITEEQAEKMRKLLGKLAFRIKFKIEDEDSTPE